MKKCLKREIFIVTALPHGFACCRYGCAHFEFDLPRKCRPVRSPDGHVSTKVANLQNFAEYNIFIITERKGVSDDLQVQSSRHRLAADLIPSQGKVLLTHQRHLQISTATSVKGCSS